MQIRNVQEQDYLKVITVINDGWGRELYHHFFQTVKQKGCDTIRCITSPVNKGSISFHTKLGFAVEKGDKMVDGIDVTSNYDGKGNDRVTFVKKI